MDIIKKGVLYIILFILLVCFFFSLFKIIKWIRDSVDSKKQVTDILDIVQIEEIYDGEIITSEEPPENPYWDFIKMNLINVDFDELKNKNNDTIGWIQVGGTNINYPIVKTNDNEFYLNHAFDKSYNDAGWVFMDYRNETSLSDKNTIIYAHSRLDNTMFGTLKNVLSNGWLNDSNNYVIKLSTEYENTLWQVFSVYKIPTTSDYLKINFGSDFENFINMLKNRSQFNFNTSVSSTDRILTLSTCYDDSTKTVLHAKLIKKQERKP